jgi:mono/diheme cytochrome c family protein
MKRTSYILSALIILVVVATGCGGPKREPGRIYAPDMTYSRAMESYPNMDTSIYTQSESNAGNRIYYDRKPVSGSVRRGQMMVYHPTDDSAGIKASDGVNNPLPDTSMSAGDKAEAERLYNIYCGICHGPKLDGQGPLIASGKWAGVAANLLDLSKFGRAVYSDGHVFHSITYGKNTMGGYASQLDVKQRWMIVNFIRSKQNAAAPKAATAPVAGAAGKAADTTKPAKP